jgi:hypothetical protein
MIDSNIDYKTKKYHLKIQIGTQNTVIKMTTTPSILRTSSLPNTCEILAQKLPGVFKTKCFNEDELPFRKEARNTELGHLFEHILLEYLCEYKIRLGSRHASFCGETSWNWVKEKRGVFNITLSSTLADSHIFYLALEKSIKLLDFIIKNGKDNLIDNKKLYNKNSPYKTLVI